MTRFSCVEDRFRRSAVGLILRGRLCSKSHLHESFAPCRPRPVGDLSRQYLLLHEHHREKSDHLQDQRYYRFEKCGKEGRLDPPATGPDSHEIWAPELHFLNSKWYIYFAADAGTNQTH